jgi:hypothetical protein
LFVLIAQLIFTRSLSKATFPFLFIWNLVLIIGFGTLSHKHLRNVVRGSRSVARAPQNRCVQCVQGTDLLSCTHNSFNYHTLTLVRAMCAGCAGIFKLLQTFFQNSVLFFKTNFNLNLPCTHCTHLYTLHGYWISYLFYPARTPARTLHKQVSSLHALTANHESRPIFKEN